MTLHPLFVATLGALALSSGHALADEGDIDTQLDLRYRLETVDDADFAKDATASTLRSQLSAGFKLGRGFSGRISLRDVSIIGADDYRSGAPQPDGNADRPVVADPPNTELNQAWLRYGNDRFTATVGRQLVVLDKQRFVGAVGWRQTEQSFLAARLGVSLSEHWQLDYIAIDRAYRIFGPDSAAGRHDLSGTHLLHLDGDLPRDFGELKLFHYRIDNQDVAAFSTATTGLNWSGQYETATLPIFWQAGLAYQSDAANGPRDFSAQYQQLKIGTELGTSKLDAQLERLSGDEQAGAAFRTPLATLHAFNGWADRFLATPQTGLVDKSIGANGTVAGMTWSARWHWFHSDAGSQHLGNELDLSLSRKLTDHLSAQLKFADFNGSDAGPADTRKLWFSLSASF